MPGLKIYFYVEMVFLHVGQAGLEFLTLSDEPALAFQSVGITGMIQHGWSLTFYCWKVLGPSPQHQTFL